MKYAHNYLRQKRLTWIYCVIKYIAMNIGVYNVLSD